MIVVASHGTRYVSRCVESMMRLDRRGHAVMLLDGPGFDTGKYLRATRASASSETAFCFLQDSVEIRDPAFFVKGFEAVRERPIVSVYEYPGNSWGAVEGPGSKRFIERVLGPGSLEYENGVFGPMFFCSGAFAREAAKLFKEEPQSKLDQEAMESGWPIFAARQGLGPVPSLYGRMPWPLPPDPYRAAQEFNLPLVKHFPRRR